MTRGELVIILKLLVVLRGVISMSDLQSFRPVTEAIYTFNTTSHSANLPSRYATDPGSICKKKTMNSLVAGHFLQEARRLVEKQPRFQEISERKKYC